MPRPSRNVDARLLAAGRELYPSTGAAGLTVRKVAARAKANAAMFHYHFGTKDAFVRTLLQGLYEPMFAELQTATAAQTDSVAGLRSALRVIARFGRNHRVLLRRLFADAARSEAPAIDFVRANFPRHAAIVARLIVAGQQSGRLRRVPVAQALSFIAGAVAAPILVGSAIVESGLASPALTQTFEADVLSDAALDERVELALAGLAVPGAT